MKGKRRKNGTEKIISSTSIAHSIFSIKINERVAQNIGRQLPFQIMHERDYYKFYLIWFLNCRFKTEPGACNR